MSLLLSFRLENFRSVSGRLEFSLLPSSAVRHQSRPVALLQEPSLPGLMALPSAVVFGPNASGKSNLLKGLRALSRLLAQSREEEETPSLAAFYEPFRLRAASVPPAPLHLGADFVTDEGIIYRYNLSFLPTHIVEESLEAKKPRQRFIRLFMRQGQQVKWAPSVRRQAGIGSHIRADQPVLAQAALETGYLHAPWMFLSTGIYPFVPEEINDLQSEQLFARLAQWLYERPDDPFIRNLKSLMAHADTGISNLSAIPGADGKLQVRTAHLAWTPEGSQEIWFSLPDESDGTRRLLLLGALILQVLEDGAILLADELDRQLHTRVTRLLVAFFHQPEINRRNAQLIFTAHDIHLLDGADTYTALRAGHVGCKMFAFDQIWMAEKDHTGTTHLFSLSEVDGLRSSTPVKEWYLSGRFGALPLIDQQALESELKDHDQKTRNTHKNPPTGTDSE